MAWRSHGNHRESQISYIRAFSGGELALSGASVGKSVWSAQLPFINTLSTPPPPVVFHYQVKMHLFSKTRQTFTEQPMKISLYGSHGEKENIPFVLYVYVKYTATVTVNMLMKRNLKNKIK